jgi:hypothetical protein
MAKFKAVPRSRQCQEKINPGWPRSGRLRCTLERGHRGPCVNQRAWNGQMDRDERAWRKSGK